MWKVAKVGLGSILWSLIVCMCVCVLLELHETLLKEGCKGLSPGQPDQIAAFPGNGKCPGTKHRYEVLKRTWLDNISSL